MSKGEDKNKCKHSVSWEWARMCMRDMRGGGEEDVSRQGIAKEGRSVKVVH